MSFVPKFLQQAKDAEGIAEGITMHIAEMSFHKFREQKFREILNFSGIGQEEQDRIFNELVITGLCLVYLTLERGENENPHEKSKNSFRQIKNNLTGSYVKRLRDGGVEKDLTDLWYQLIAMRCEEYRKDYSDHKELFSDPRENYWVRVCAIGGSDHICRGNSELIEKLLPDFSQWCGQVFISSMRIVAKEVRATDSSSGKEVNVHLNDDGSMDIK